MARSKAALLGTASVFVTIALIGVTTISDDAATLGSWKISGEHLMQTAAAELEGDMPTFADEIPAPDTAPTVNQDRLRSLVMTGQLDAVITETVDADQASLNMQWRIVSVGQTLGICQDLPAGESFTIPVGGSMSMSGLNPDAAVDLRYSSSDAVRQFQVPATAVGLQTLSKRTAEGTVETAPVRVCSSGT